MLVTSLTCSYDISAQIRGSAAAYPTFTATLCHLVLNQVLPNLATRIFLRYSQN
jgi:hypothetical protein